MADILSRYGIKEVADVTFYKLDDNGKPENPVLFLDTLKVSTIEQTAEEATANGGKGNAPLITWDYGKEINVTLQDALFSVKSMAIMFGGGKYSTLNDSATASIMRTEYFTPTSEVSVASIRALTSASSALAGWDPLYKAAGNKAFKGNVEFYTDSGASVSNSGTLSTNAKYLATYDLSASNVTVIEISADNFPGNYYVTGDTYARNEANGKDEFFQFIIPKAKITSEHTLTMEADGDPSVFDLNLKVLRPADGVMMKLVKYSLESDTNTSSNVTLIHNHNLIGESE